MCCWTGKYSRIWPSKTSPVSKNWWDLPSSNSHRQRSSLDLPRDSSPGMNRNGERRSSLSRSRVVGELREVDIECGGRNGNLPQFEHFRMDFPDHADGSSCDNNLPCPAFQKRRMLHRF